MCALREQYPDDEVRRSGQSRDGGFAAPLLAALALAALLATAMVPYLAPPAHEHTPSAAPASVAARAWDRAPVMPASALGDQHYEFTRAAWIVSR